MISSSTISLILWLPFILVILVSGVIFCLSGYKKGLWRALISLGVTLVSAVISFFLSKLIAGVAAGGIVTGILSAMPAGDPATGILKTLLPSLIQGLLAVFIFAGVFFLITLIGKIAANVVKKDMFVVSEEEKNLKWGGLGVRAADAIIFALLFLLPLYGTVGTYAPTLQAVFKLGGEETAVYAELLAAATKHPLVALTTGTPIGGVYVGLSDTTGSGNKGDGSVNVNVAEVVGTVDKLMTKFDKFNNAQTEADKKAATLELIAELKNGVVDSKWGYQVINQATGVLKDQLVNSMTDATPEDIKAVETVVAMLDMTEEEFKANGGIMLDYAEYALSNDVMASLEGGDMSKLKNDTFYEETATFLNASTQTKEIKKYVLTETMTALCGGNTEAAGQIMESYDEAAVSTPEAQKQEIQALIELSTAESAEDAMKAIESIPSIDSEKLADVLKNLGGN